MTIAWTKSIVAAGLLAALVVVFPASPVKGEDPAKPDPARFGRGAKAWAENCGRCHNIRDPKEFTDSQWDVIMTHMRIRANLPGDMADDIRVFLKGSN
jgi:mono/diheme cytochrome c family protein